MVFSRFWDVSFEYHSPSDSSIASSSSSIGTSSSPLSSSLCLFNVDAAKSPFGWAVLLSPLTAFPAVSLFGAVDDEGGALNIESWSCVVTAGSAETGILKVPSSLATVFDFPLAYDTFWRRGKYKPCLVTGCSRTIPLPKNSNPSRALMACVLAWTSRNTMCACPLIFIDFNATTSKTGP